LSHEADRMENNAASRIRLATLLAFLAVAAVASAYLSDVQPLVKAQASGNQQFTYFYEVDEDGNVQVDTRFRDETTQDSSSWVVVPSFTAWQNQTTGLMLAANVQPIITAGATNPFWANYSFAYRPRNGSFDLSITFNVSQYAYIIEPNGFLLSSEIEFNPSARGSLVVVMPSGSSVSRSNVTLIDYTRGGSAAEPPGLSIERQADGTLRIDAQVTSHSRLAVAMTFPGETAETETLTLGRFTSQTPIRYAARTEAILELYNRSYPILRDLFDVDLMKVDFTFFVPTLEQFRSGLGGFVPFTPGGHPGAVNVNMFYFRTTEGFIEIIALHELAHHFLWQVGVTPDKLWVHEGMAQYASIEVAKLLGYRAGAEDQEQMIIGRAQTLGGHFGFVQSWGQGSLPPNIGDYYAAAYMVFKLLGDEYGGIAFYEKAFRAMKAFSDLSDDSAIATALGVAAINTTDVIRQFESWGFVDVIDVSQLEGLLGFAQVLVSGVNPLLQPYKAAAQWLLGLAGTAYDTGHYSNAWAYLITSLFFAENALALTVLTYAGAATIAGAAYWVHVQLSYRRARAPYQPMRPVVHPSMAARFCYRCGTVLPDGAVFCPECGSRRLQSPR